MELTIFRQKNAEKNIVILLLTKNHTEEDYLLLSEDFSGTFSGIIPEQELMRRKMQCRYLQINSELCDNADHCVVCITMMLVLGLGLKNSSRTRLQSRALKVNLVPWSWP
jgi:hypothetical protein